MLLSSSGSIDTGIVSTVISHVSGHYAPLSLPICVDFDSVYDQTCPSRCVPRNNLDNSIESTFYISKPEQAIINQAKLNNLPDKGDFFAVLPCLNLQLEDNKNFSNNLVVEIFSVGEDKLIEIITEVKGIHAKLDTTTLITVDEDKRQHVDFYVGNILVGSASTFELPNGKLVSRGTALYEPVFSYALNQTK